MAVQLEGPFTLGLFAFTNIDLSVLQVSLFLLDVYFFLITKKVVIIFILLSFIIQFFFAALLNSYQ